MGIETITRTTSAHQNSYRTLDEVMETPLEVDDFTKPLTLVVGGCANARATECVALSCTSSLT